LREDPDWEILYHKRQRFPRAVKRRGR
jgi:hypothetical protein